MADRTVEYKIRITNAGGNAIGGLQSNLAGLEASREEHRAFWNHVWAKDDPFWTYNQPGNLYNCKCDWEETGDPADSAASGGGTPAIAHRGLEGNPGMTGEIFTGKHPYIDACSKATAKKVLRFVGGKILRKETLQSLKRLQGKAAKAKGAGGGEIDVLFDSKTTAHVSNDVALGCDFLRAAIIEGLPELLGKSALVAREKNKKPGKKPSAVEYFYYEYKIGKTTFYFNVEENNSFIGGKHFYRLYSVTDKLRKSVAPV